jgi:hypothetical protein
MVPHATDFYIAHHLYSNPRAFPNGPVWGALSDGPEDRRQVIDRINELVDEGTEPTLKNVRVWHFQADVPVRDVTEDIIADAEKIAEDLRDIDDDLRDVEWIE